MTGILPLDISAPFLHDLVPLAVSALDLSSNDHAIIKQAAWLIANVAAGLDDIGEGGGCDDNGAAPVTQQLRQLVVGDQVRINRLLGVDTKEGEGFATLLIHGLGTVSEFFGLFVFSLSPSSSGM